jgi:4-aminobutyrate aminotransferase
VGALSDVWSRVTDLDVVSAHGCWVVASDGASYLDFTSGIAVASTGHCHPEVVAAIQHQAERFIHAQVNVYRHDLLVPLAERLLAITPDGIDRFFFANSGAEAVEAAVKLVKQATGRPNIVVFQGSFHGRTHLAMAMTTSKSVYRAGHAPLPAGVFVAPFPGSTAADVEVALAGFDLLLESQTAPHETAAVIIEPVLGEGGYLPAPAGFLRGLAHRCHAHGIVLVADEVQSGFGRTGKMFAVEHSGVEPDVLVMGKGIASGFPLSAMGASAALMDRWPTGSHGGTYGGNPIGCAAALATIGVLTGPGLLDSVVARGRQLIDGLRRCAASDPGVIDVRGLGLMVACELADPLRVRAILRHCVVEGRLLLMTAGTHSTTIRWMPPLVVTEAEISTAITAFGRALAATS